MAVDFSGKSTAEALASVEGHVNDDAKHREINDSGTGPTDLWSAQKLTSSLEGKANTSHTHTESQITDLDHNAQKIKGSPVEAPVAGQDGYLMYWDETTDTMKWTINSILGVASQFFTFDNGSNASSHNKGDFRGVNASNFRISFAVPDDLQSIVKIEMIYIAQSTRTTTWTVNTDYGAIGENFALHSGSTTVNKSQTINNITAVDITAAYTNLTAGDFCGTYLQSSSTEFYLGLKITYNRG